MNTVYDCAQYVDGSDKNYTMIVYRPGEARDLPVMMHGNVASLGEIAPRHFLTVLSKGDSAFHQGSGRLELADDIFGDGAPLAARVIVNRVWGWHFGKPLVATTSDFGVQGEKPTHPDLLDDLAARFIAHGCARASTICCGNTIFPIPCRQVRAAISLPLRCSSCS